MTDEDRHNIARIDYQRLTDELAPNRTEEEFRDCQFQMRECWFDRYYRQLNALGYRNDGESRVQTVETFTYCNDHTYDNDLADEWWHEYREHSRIVAVSGFSAPTREKRPDSRLRGLGYAYTYEFAPAKTDPGFDRGHYIAHSIGGEVDNGVFGQRSDINQGHGELGRLYRSMETYAFKNPGTFVFSRPIYGDGTSHPFFFEYGILKPDWTWWVEVFPNRYTYTPYRGEAGWPEWYREHVEAERKKAPRRRARHKRKYEKWKAAHDAARAEEAASGTGSPKSDPSDAPVGGEDRSPDFPVNKTLYGHFVNAYGWTVAGG